MVPLRIAGLNVADAGILTASSSVVNLPPDRMQVEDINDVWRATTPAAWVLCDLGAATDICVMAMINSNATASADSFQVRISNSDPSGAAGEVYDSGVVLSNTDAVYRRIVHFIEPVAVGRYLRVDLNQAENPEAGRFVAGRTWNPSRNFSFGWESTWRDWSRRSRSLGQTLFIDRGNVAYDSRSMA